MSPCVRQWVICVGRSMSDACSLDFTVCGVGVGRESDEGQDSL